MPQIINTLSRKKHAACADAQSTSLWSRATGFVLRKPSGAPMPGVPHNIGNICPITREPIDLLQDVVLATDNYLYDRKALSQMLTLSPLSPMTRQPMPDTSIELVGCVARRPGAPRGVQEGFDAAEVVMACGVVAVGLGALGGGVSGILVGRLLMGPQSAQSSALTMVFSTSIQTTLSVTGGLVAGTGTLLMGLFSVDAYLRFAEGQAESLQLSASPVGST